MYKNPACAALAVVAALVGIFWISAYSSDIAASLLFALCFAGAITLCFFPAFGKLSDREKRLENVVMLRTILSMAAGMIFADLVLIS